MAEDQKKASSSATTSPPSTSTAPPQPAKPATPSKGSSISRRTFLIGAIGASTLLTAAAFYSSGDILGPLIPPAEPPTVIANAAALETRYQNAKKSTIPNELYIALGNPNDLNNYFAEFFSWPYSISESPYYKSIVVRLPDEAPTTPEQYLGQTYTSTPIAAPTGGRFVAYNTTCVHLRCLVNPGYAGAPGSGQFRLQCPCHGSQYNLADGVPVAGPAFDLGLQPLPKVELSIDSSGNITATSLAGVPGVGRTTQ
jgi:Rieske Fe-S protein